MTRWQAGGDVRSLTALHLGGGDDDAAALDELLEPGAELDREEGRVREQLATSFASYL
jgi:hypothetical protein